MKKKKKGKDGFHAQGRISSISQRCARPIDANGNAADQITQPDREAGPKERKARVICLCRRSQRDARLIHLGREYNGHDDAVNGNDFAKDDGDEILGSDSRSFDAGAEDGGSGD